jgi:rhamnulose-1-phosphate aldolase/alcohol dehydrogenase
MQSGYSDADAKRAIESYAERGVPEAVALRTYTARLLGANPALVLHGGGNTSVKTTAKTLLGESIAVIHVKGSGWDLATIEPPGHPAVRLEPLKKLRALSAMTDEAMVNELRLNLLDASAPTPSVETLLHAYLPATYIDHTHADAVLAIADQKDAEAICRKLYGPGLVWVPYVMPGFALAKRCAEAFDAVAAHGQTPGVIVLERHGIFTFGDTAKQSYERMIDAVTRAERHIADARRTQIVALDEATTKRAKETLVLPRLRGALAKLAGTLEERGPILATVRSDDVLSFMARKDAFELSQVGCATPDHVLRTKPTALFVKSPAYDDPAKLSAQLESEIAAYAQKYDAYFHEMSAKKQVRKTKLEPWPVVFLLPGIGMCVAGKTLKEARVAADVYLHTIGIMSDAADIGTYAPVPLSDLFDVEYWSLEQAKLKPAAQAPLSGRVALVTGAASGIGRATAASFAKLGAHVALVDRDREKLDAVEKELARAHGAAIVSVAADVTNEAEVERAVAAAVSAFGGLDVVVSNAGNAPEGRLDTSSGEAALRASLELNLMAHNHVAKAAAEVMLAQGRGGCLLFNASKSAFNQGPNFGPYAVAKSALVSLMRQYAVDLGPHGIRANAVNADRIRTALFGGGVLESRAAARGLTADEYFRANLLHREVAASDVADSFAYLATARATTGCVITVDGGNAAAFPR